MEACKALSAPSLPCSFHISYLLPLSLYLSLSNGPGFDGGGAAEEERPLKVAFESPAEHFTDAAPIGNGSLGAMVWGGVASEKLQLNHGSLWTGVPGD
ncbi:alpha-L-fucosidase 2-like [Phragmites australis]|uniref:alpha-L-fucosidase 2-like n=1 Tax=Phragmites australis TaxID=29695 RepID=UPI002D7802C2|nr:alpha-L-fucosidase 2-like [Phragmites australis]